MRTTVIEGPAAAGTLVGYVDEIGHIYAGGDPTVVACIDAAGELREGTLGDGHLLGGVDGEGRVYLGPIVRGKVVGYVNRVGHIYKGEPGHGRLVGATTGNHRAGAAAFHLLLSSELRAEPEGLNHQTWTKVVAVVCAGVIVVSATVTLRSLLG